MAKHNKIHINSFSNIQHKSKCKFLQLDNDNYFRSNLSTSISYELTKNIIRRLSYPSSNENIFFYKRKGKYNIALAKACYKDKIMYLRHTNSANNNKHNIINKCINYKINSNKGEK